MKSLSLIALAPLAIVVALVGGCAGSTDSPSLFLLEKSYPADNRAAPASPVLMIDPVTVAPYLAGSGLVYQTEAHRVVVANNNRWASPLAGQLTDGLYATLSGVLDNVAITRAGGSHPTDTLHLTVHVEQFMGHYDGYAHIAGQWQLLDRNGKRLASQRFEQRIPLPRNGYDALVASLSRGWRTTAEAMASTLARNISTR